MVFDLQTFSFTESVEGDPTPPKSFSLKELRVATHNFSRNNFLAQGAYYIVYQVRLADGLLVAVKKRCHVNWRLEEQFDAEMQVGSTISPYPNVLCLRGNCRTKKELLLVSPLMINNTLSYNLRERPDQFARPLDWPTRMQIALGAARGLAHLHNQGNIKIMHRDICASNILLNAHFEAMIGGFLNAMIMDERNVEEGTSSGPRALQGRARKSHFNPSITMKMFTSTAPSVANLGLLPPNQLGRVIDRNLQGNYVEEEAEQQVGLALLCAYEDPPARPEMSEVLRMLESQLLQRDPSTRSSWSQSDWDSTPYYSFPPPSPLGIVP
ncbi:hypothetical protein NL676_001635 [Syzygium grande]|nr:hypothetical protein NL676_001635 [Syzygium grande]